MPRFVEVVHEERIAAPEHTVRAQFADLHHHIAANVHPKLRSQVRREVAAAAAEDKRDLEERGYPAISRVSVASAQPA